MSQWNVKTEWRWRGFHSGEWIVIDGSLDNSEAIAVAAGGAAAAAATTTLPAPANVIVPAVLAAHAAQVGAQNKGNGVTIYVEGAMVAPVPTMDVTIAAR